MDVTELPFNQFVGIKKCETKPDGIFELSADPKYLNHVDTVHASALFALAEASSGQFLSEHLEEAEERVVPILRRAEIKYKKPAEGYLYTKGAYKEDAWKLFHESFDKKGRALLSFQIDVLNEEDAVVAYAIYEWFFTEKT
ncbi:MAG: YiiD C-terminal domain-containing protein [Verrucomicrobia bacterium]|nr:YiiD C-terminal domain-containing protein [Verrucomicrobiota bacterium]MDA1066078.1 YiiD C-terminal domain-containing protein [Verrucomicrobiota bacterium]